MGNQPFFIPTKPRLRRRRHLVDAPAPTQASIVAVIYQGDGFTVQIAFNVPVTTDGSDIPQLVIETYSGAQGLSGVSQADAMSIYASCADGGVDVGQAWSVSSAPTGLTFAGALPLELPESGATS